MTNRCPTCGAIKKRSIPQNKRLHDIIGQIAEYPGVAKKCFSTKVLKTYFKDLYLGYEEVPLPNGKRVEVLRSTANLPTDEFNEFMQKVELWAAERGIPLNLEDA